jgi:hypothetical protein
VRSLAQDVRSLREVAATQAEKIRFLLDATLGVINIRQSDVIKIFSVVAFVFLPPTLIASIYGMNFDYMPELSWPWGYPMALGMMVVSALVPYLFFRWKKWLCPKRKRYPMPALIPTTLTARVVWLGLPARAGGKAGHHLAAAGGDAAELCRV